MSDSREFWSEDDIGQSTCLAITYTDAEATAVWDALRRARRYVEERTHNSGTYKGRFIRSYYEDETPQVKYAADLEREGDRPMNDTTALQDQALAAAADVLVQLPTLPPEMHRMVLHALAIAWIEGRQAGGNEAAAIIRELLASIK